MTKATSPRTQVLAPRLIASLVVLCSLFILYQGIETLREAEAQPLSVFDSLLQTGKYSWKLASPSVADKACVGIIESDFQFGSPASLTLSGKIRLAGKAKSSILEFQGGLTFEEFFRLKKLQGRYSVNEKQVHFSSSEESPTLLKVNMQTEHSANSFKMQREAPIFLTKRKDGSVSLGLPSSLRARYHPKNAGWDFSQLTPEEKARCISSLGSDALWDYTRFPKVRNLKSLEEARNEIDFWVKHLRVEE